MKVIAAILHVVAAAVLITPVLIQYALLRIFSPGRLKNDRGKRVSEEGVQHPPVKGVHHEHILCDDVRIHVARAGMDVSKKLILFLHGFPEFWYSWRAQIEDLQDTYEVAAIDLPGYNASGKLSNVAHYVTQDICRIVAGVLNGLCREDCILVGHDWGAAIASDFAAMYPKKVSKLALLAVPPGPLFMKNIDLTQFTKSIYMWRFLVPGIMESMFHVDDWAGLRKVLTTAAVGGPIRRPMGTEEVEHFLDAIATPGSLTAAFNYYRASLWHTGVLRLNKEVRYAWKANPRHPMPLLVVIGDSDAFVYPNSFKGIGRVAAKASVHFLPDCSHWIQQDAPDDVNRLLRSFADAADEGIDL